MLYDIYYIVTPQILQQPVKSTADATLVLAIDPANKNELSSCFQAAEQYINNPFCLLLTLQAALTPEQATALMAFFFFPNYLKPAVIPQIFVTGNNEGIVAAGIESLQQSAAAQAFSTIGVMPASNLENSYEARDTSVIKEAYKTRLLSPVMTTEAVYIRIAREEEIAGVQQLLTTEETLFEQQHAVLFTLKKQNRQLQQQVLQLGFLYQAAQQEISNQVSHNQILRSSSQATALQNYYNNEYEVLPLWYKRMGHIIKVLMGKRSFKSLYSDSSKKYRN
ncbi:hypothetical protein A4D02_07285 [Niastella koreensis]|uniref:Uncharacterized protein n=2 Tax=Niastella koreensis TaxID=354356 RepID=G8TII2_NIAKG|nr:hypothetical protein [Niastella koreensis]AEW01798.1 hypothetical protein Niako_5566 [Niastella koreensis GR20-10]OQP48507.1 hypothetical protein A4D02_07285 [Niastella koreensis]